MSFDERPVRKAVDEIRKGKRCPAEVMDSLDLSPRERQIASGRMAVAQESEKLDDRVLSNAAKLDPADRSLEAQQIRETAASIRDHRANDHRRWEQEARDASQAELEIAERLYRERDLNRQAAQDISGWDNWVLKGQLAADAEQAEKKAEQHAFSSAALMNAANLHAQQAEQYLSANDAYHEELDRPGAMPTVAWSDPVDGMVTGRYVNPSETNGERR